MKFLLLLVSLVVCSGINLLGVIYGAESHYCDGFYWSRPICQGQDSCSIPLNATICLKYGKPNPQPVNVLHANWECGETFMSANLAEGQGDELVLRCPPSGATDAPHGALIKAPVVAERADPATITILGAVIGSSGIYCDAYFKSAPICNGKESCVLPIDSSLCSVGEPNPNQEFNFMHLMFACGGKNFGRIQIRQSEKFARLSC